jgi:hypothetical protein
MLVSSVCTRLEELDSRYVTIGLSEDETAKIIVMTVSSVCTRLEELVSTNWYVTSDLSEHGTTKIIIFLA